MNKPTTKADDLNIPGFTREQLGKGERGKYFDRVQKASNVVVIEPCLSKVFPNSASVNEALQRFVEIAVITSSVSTRSKTF